MFANLVNKHEIIEEIDQIQNREYQIAKQNNKPKEALY